MNEVEGPLYIRVRGKAQGPYSADHLQLLARRGQFSRMHEVSSDGISWVRASTFPSLFTVERNSVSDAKQKTAASQDYSLASGEPGPPKGSPTKSGAGKWYYTSGGAECKDPVDLASLQALIARGALGKSDMVWTDGMPDWSSPQSVPGLASAAINSRSSAYTAFNVGDGQSEQITNEACRAIAGSRPWLLFIAICIFIWAGLSSVGGIFQLILGGQQHNSVQIAGGLFSVIFGILSALLGTMLTTYFNLLGNVVYLKSPRQLEAALHAGRRFWIFVGVILIVLLSFGAVIAVWIIALGSPLAR